MTPLLSLLAICFGIVLGILAIIFLVVPLLKGIGWMIGGLFNALGWLLRHTFEFVGGMLKDTVCFVGAIIAWVVLLPLLRLRASLVAACDAPAQADTFTLERRPDNEIGEAMEAANRLLDRVARTHREELNRAPLEPILATTKNRVRGPSTRPRGRPHRGHDDEQPASRLSADPRRWDASHSVLARGVFLK